MVETVQERMKRIEEQKKYIKEHEGHEDMHAKMMLDIFVTLFATQIFLFFWEKRHKRSYNAATLFGMLIIPPIWAISAGFTRFLIIWTIYSLVTAVIVRKATRKPLDRWTPRVVYGYFLKVFKLTYGVGTAGYLGFLIAFFGFPGLLMHAEAWLEMTLNLLFYGVYFGVVTKDLADYCTDRMASTMGFVTDDGMPMKHLNKDTCGVCGETNIGCDENGVPEKQHTLPCGHSFHDYCIRGWVIVGKKQICPVCKEKVDLKQFSSTPWEKVYVMYSGFLDWCRLMVCWMPVITSIVHGINHVMGYE